MAYLVSRSICQGRAAELVSLGGVVLGFIVYVLLAAFGITALIFAIPYAYDALRVAGSAYLAYLAWRALKPSGASPFQPRSEAHAALIRSLKDRLELAHRRSKPNQINRHSSMGMCRSLSGLVLDKVFHFLKTKVLLCENCDAFYSLRLRTVRCSIRFTR
jgi:hypothetical protein